MKSEGFEELTRRDMERVTAAVLDRAARGDALSPAALTFLVRRYRTDSQPDVSEVLGHALAVALAQHVHDRSTSERSDWLRAFTEALTVSEDPRLADAARDLIAGLAGDWPSAAIVADGAASVEACLVASHLADSRDLVPRAIDELERIVAGAYRPGRGVAHTTDSAVVPGERSDHVQIASTLLTAFEITGRLPYSMLAEELMQASRDRLFDADLVVSCDAARVFWRLAALHDDTAYRGAAVIAPDADYRADAERILARMSACLADTGADVARYGLALDEYGARHRSS